MCSFDSFLNEVNEVIETWTGNGNSNWSYEPHLSSARNPILLHTPENYKLRCEVAQNRSGGYILFMFLDHDDKLKQKKIITFTKDLDKKLLLSAVNNITSEL